MVSLKKEDDSTGLAKERRGIPNWVTPRTRCTAWVARKNRRHAKTRESRGGTARSPLSDLRRSFVPVYHQPTRLQFLSNTDS